MCGSHRVERVVSNLVVVGVDAPIGWGEVRNGHLDQRYKGLTGRDNLGY